MSPSADLAYSYGKYSLSRDGSTEAGHFFQIWQTDATGLREVEAAAIGSRRCRKKSRRSRSPLMWEDGPFACPDSIARRTPLVGAKLHGGPSHIF